MDENEVRARLEDIGLNEEQIADVLPLVATPHAEPAVESGLRAAQEEMYQRIQDEPDWRKRAAMAARMISLTLE